MYIVIEKELKKNNIIEFELTKNSLKSKGYKFKLNNLDLYIKPIMISILKKTDEFERTLIVKSY